MQYFFSNSLKLLSVVILLPSIVFNTVITDKDFSNITKNNRNNIHIVTIQTSK